MGDQEAEKLETIDGWEAVYREGEKVRWEKAGVEYPLYTEASCAARHAEALRAALVQTSDPIELDFAGFGRWPRLTAPDGATLLRKPYQRADYWHKLMSDWLNERPGLPIMCGVFHLSRTDLMEGV